jgi:hypothetical protein
MMKSLTITLGLAAATAATLGWAQALAQDAPQASAQAPQGALQVDNSGKRPIVAVYSSPPGLADWSDDIVGKTALKPGQSRKLALKAKPQACKVDVMAMQDNGDTATKRDIDMCAAQPSVGF